MSKKIPWNNGKAHGATGNAKTGLRLLDVCARCGEAKLWDRAAMQGTTSTLFAKAKDFRVPHCGRKLAASKLRMETFPEHVAKLQREPNDAGVELFLRQMEPCPTTRSSSSSSAVVATQGGRRAIVRPSADTLGQDRRFRH